MAGVPAPVARIPGPATQGRADAVDAPRTAPQAQPGEAPQREMARRNGAERDDTPPAASRAGAGAGADARAVARGSRSAKAATQATADDTRRAGFAQAMEQARAPDPQGTDEATAEWARLSAGATDASAAGEAGATESDPKDAKDAGGEGDGPAAALAAMLGWLQPVAGPQGKSGDAPPREDGDAPGDARAGEGAQGIAGIDGAAAIAGAAGLAGGAGLAGAAGTSTPEGLTAGSSRAGAAAAAGSTMNGMVAKAPAGAPNVLAPGAAGDAGAPNAVPTLFDQALQAAAAPSNREASPSADTQGEATTAKAAATTPAPTAGAAGASAGAIAARGTAAAPPAERTVPVPMGDRHWARALATQVSVLANHKVEAATLRLSPEHTGPVEVRIELKDAAVNVAFNASQADTRAALEQALPQLRAALAGSGLALGQATVGQQMRHGSQFTSATPNGTADAADHVEVTPALIRPAGLVDEYA